MKTIDAMEYKRKTQQSSFDLKKIARQIGMTLGVILLFLLAILLALPVMLLPLSTSVPAPVWILLAVTGLVVIVLPFHWKPPSRGIILAMSGMILVSILAVVSSQLFARTPPITDANGNMIPGVSPASKK